MIFLLFFPISPGRKAQTPIKERDKLLLQESYFKLLHLLAPYFAKVVLKRLKDTYISPQLEMYWDILFFRACTVSSVYVGSAFVAR
jgi:hypothetical protein